MNRCSRVHVSTVSLVLQRSGRLKTSQYLKRRHTSEATGKIIFRNDDLVDIDLLCMRGDEKS